jgi:hypothetical protein
VRVGWVAFALSQCLANFPEESLFYAPFCPKHGPHGPQYLGTSALIKMCH